MSFLEKKGLVLSACSLFNMHSSFSQQKEINCEKKSRDLCSWYLQYRFFIGFSFKFGSYWPWKKKWKNSNNTAIKMWFDVMITFMNMTEKNNTSWCQIFFSVFWLTYFWHVAQKKTDQNRNFVINCSTFRMFSKQMSSYCLKNMTVEVFC